MKIDLTKSELGILILLLEELVSRCQDSEVGLNYPGKNIVCKNIKNY